MSKHYYEQNLIPCQSLNQYWENYLSPQYGIEDLDHDSIYKTIAEAVRKNRIPAYAMREGIEEILVRLQLIEDGKIKNAALVLFAKDHVYLPQCQIKMARFRGVDKLGDFYDNQRVSGNVFKLLDAADAFLRRHLPISSTFKSDQLRRIDQPALPVMATREALVNALCHRDYADQNTDFSLAVFDDRLELWNSGTLPHKLSFSSLKKSHESIPRNKLIAHVFYIRDLIEKWGTGTNKIVSLCQDDGLPEPEFSERTGGFLVTFYFKNPISSYVSSQEDAPSHTKIVTLSNRQNEIIKIIKKHQTVNIQGLMAELKNPPSQRMVQKDLQSLREMGIVSRTSSAKNTFWTIDTE